MNNYSDSDILIEGVGPVSMDRQRLADIIADEYGVDNVRVFGSVARGQAHEDSDLDLLVDVRPGIGLRLMTLIIKLEALLGRKVDLVPADSLREYVRDQVLREAKPL